ncbi:MAG: DNA gyrase subunit A [Anaerolineae bacterium]|nr:DNA gyrase subunit A [Anaerolineae bacterium]
MEIGTIQQVDIDETMRNAYLDYAMSVIVARALPDARDGLKPVHRRILYAMHDMGLRHSTPHRKSARIVGEVLGKYHPHGDTAVYDAMARMAQDFSMRYPLIDGQGNFGSVDGDSPAAMRYTEARMARIAEEMMVDIDKDTVELVDNFDGSLREPVVLTARLPNLLLNGTSGIAVGMATNIAPHNLGELCDAIAYLIDHYAEREEVTAEDLMAFVQGPDFPTGGLIVGSDGIVNAYATGKGRITMRAVTHVEDMRGNRNRIVITELPYQVNKSTLIERIATLVREERIEEITDLRDESDRRGMSIVLELKRGAEPSKVLDQLFKYTQLQQTFGYNCLALVDGAPRTLSLKQALLIYVEHRRDVIVRRSHHDLARARARAHILEGLRTALDHLDAVIAAIRDSPDAERARTNLMERFELSEEQANAILDMQLRRLAALERQKIEDEYTDVIQRIAYLEDLLANPRKILYLIHEDVIELKRRYGDIRRTHLVSDTGEGVQAGDLVPDVQVLISITRQGYIKRTPAVAYHLGGKERAHRAGVQGMETREEDSVTHVFPAGTLNSALFFTNKGKVYEEKVYQIPEGDRASRGLPLRNLMRLEENERVTAALPVADLQAQATLTMFTVQGKVKRVPLDEFATVRASGLSAIALDEGDELGWVHLTDGSRELLVATACGRALRFPESDVNPRGRSAAGIGGVRLSEGDQVAGVAVIEPGGQVLTVSQNGFAKRTDASEFPVQGRNTGGVIALHSRYQDVTGPLVAALVVQPGDEVTLITSDGMVLHTDAETIPESGRATRGQIVMDIYKGDRLSAVARISADVQAQGGD